MPSSLFAPSAIKNLYINHAHFTASEMLDNFLMLPSLVNVEVQEASSFVPACYFELRDEHTAPIDKVKFYIRDQSEYRGLARIGKMATTLEVIIHECECFPEYSIKSRV